MHVERLPDWNEPLAISASDVHRLVRAGLEGWYIECSETIAEDIAGALRRWFATTEEGVEGARAFFAACEPLHANHPFLMHYRLSMAGTQGLRTDAAGRVVVPCRRNGRIVSVQRINIRGDAWSWPATDLKGALHSFARRDSAVTIICRQLASALACFQAVSNSRVVLAFSEAPIRAKGLSLTTTDDWAGWRLGRLAERTAKAGRFDSPGKIESIVHAELERAIMKLAEFAA